jgi:hypothetical protein
LPLPQVESCDLLVRWIKLPVPFYWVFHWPVVGAVIAGNEIILCKARAMRTFVDIPLQNKLKRWSKYIVGAVILGAVAVLIGWHYYIDYLKSPLRDQKK